MLKVWNMVLVALAFELSVFGTFLTRSGVVNSIHSFAKSPIGWWFLAFVVISSLFSRRAHPVAAAAAEGAHEARVGALARGDVPLQQPAARRALPDDPLGRPVPDRDAAREGRDAHDRAAVLRLLPAGVRAAAAAADGHRPADRLAEDERPVARYARSPGRSAWRSSPASLLIALGAGSSKPGLIAYTFSAFVLATIVARARARHPRRRLAVPARLAQPAPLRRLHRACGDRPARDRHRGLERVRHRARAEAASRARR